jgi:hypothetical protein
MLKYIKFNKIFYKILLNFIRIQLFFRIVLVKNSNLLKIITNSNCKNIKFIKYKKILICYINIFDNGRIENLI